MKPPSISRRTLLGAVGAGAGALYLGDFLGLRHARADGGDPDKAPLLVMCEFSGGWDTLYCLDTRNHQVFGDPSGGIYTGFEMVTDAPTKAVIEGESGGTGIIQPPGCNVQYGPTMGKLAKVLRARRMKRLHPCPPPGTRPGNARATPHSCASRWERSS